MEGQPATLSREGLLRSLTLKYIRCLFCGNRNGGHCRNCPLPTESERSWRKELPPLLYRKQIFTFALARRLPTHCPFYFPLIWFKLCHEGAVHVGQPVEANAAHRLQAQVLALPGCKAFWVEKASIVPHPRVQGLPLPHCAPLHARAAPDQHLLKVKVAACLPPNSTVIWASPVLLQPCVTCVSAPGEVYVMAAAFSHL